MEEGSVREEESSILPAATRGSPEACGIDTRKATRRSDHLGQCGKRYDDRNEQQPFYKTRPAWSNGCITQQISTVNTAELLGRRCRSKKDCAAYHHKSRRSNSLDELHVADDDFGHRRVYAASDPEICGPGTCDNVGDTSERCNIDTECQEPCELNGGETCASQRSPDCVEYSGCSRNFDHEISAFGVKDHSQQFVTDASRTCLVVCAEVHASESDSDKLVLDSSCPRVDGSRVEEDITCANNIKNDEQEGCSEASRVDALAGDSCGRIHAETVLVLPLSPIRRDEMSETRRISEQSVCNECSPVGAADGDVGCPIVSCPFGVNSCSPGSASSSENDTLIHTKGLLICEEESHRDTAVFSVGASEVVAKCVNSYSPGSASSAENDTLIHSKGLLISEKTSNGDTDSCPVNISKCSSKAMPGSSDDSTGDSVCSPSCSSIGDVSCVEPTTEKEAYVSLVTIHGDDNIKSGSISKKRPSTLKVTPVYVHHALPPAEHCNIHISEDNSSQTCRTNIPVVKCSEVPHCDDYSRTSGDKTRAANTSRYSWPASQSVRVRSRSCSRLRRKHVKNSASFAASSTDWSNSRSIDHRFMSVTNPASSGFTVFQNARLGRTISSARLNDNRKSETFMISLQKEAALKARTHQRCRHKRHSYHATGGPCVSCTNHTNSLGPCFVLGVGQCNLCRDGSRSNDSKKCNDTSLVELECVESKHKTREQKAVESSEHPAETIGRNEFMQYTREKCEYSSTLGSILIGLAGRSFIVNYNHHGNF